MDLRVWLLLTLLSVLVYGIIEIFRKTDLLITAKKVADSVANISNQEQEKEKEETHEVSSAETLDHDYLESRYSPANVLSDNSVVSKQDLDSLIEKKPEFNLLKADIAGSTINIFKEGNSFQDADILSLYIFPQTQQYIDGKILYLAIKSLNLEFGHTGIFHKVEQIGSIKQAQFSLAIAQEPGIFVPEQMFETKYPGIVLFMVGSSTSAPLFAFEEMLSTARKLSCRLMAELCNSQGKKLTHNNLEYLREKVRDSQRNKVFNREKVLEV